MSLRVLLVLSLVLAGCASANVNNGADAADDGDGGGEIDAAPDIDAMACARTPCDILSQCGCEATPQSPVCDLDFNQLPVGATKCRASTLNGTEVTTCSATNTCAAQHVCVGGRCRKYCDDEADCAGPGGICLIDLTYGNPAMTIPNAPKTCTTDCNPVAASNATCPTGWACHIYVEDPTPPPGANGDETFLTDCNAPGGVGLGGTCTGNSSCNPGFDCVTLNPGGNQCRPSCACPGGNCAAGACPGGSGSCRAYTNPPVIGGVTYGVCF
ncbi:MAG TPA: hypothetical protein VM261_01120 [Kofleriaceae bacterium]|nr:hypothetical protein [Kofleriaceae bacterium]